MPKYLDENGSAVYFEGDRPDGKPIKGEGKIEKKDKKKDDSKVEGVMKEKVK